MSLPFLTQSRELVCGDLIQAFFFFFMCLSGGDLSPLELADVNGDGLRDVLLSFVASRNGSAIGKRHTCLLEAATGEAY